MKVTKKFLKKLIKESLKKYDDVINKTKKIQNQKMYPDKSVLDAERQKFDKDFEKIKNSANQKIITIFSKRIS